IFFLTGMILSTCLITGNLMAQDSLRTVAIQYYRVGDFQQAGETFEELIETGQANGIDYYNASCSWALAGDQEKALDLLDNALLYGFTNLDQVRADPDLELIRSTREFSDLIAREEAFYAEENIDYLWILEALSERPVVALRNKTHYNSIGNWLNWEGLDVMEILAARPDLPLTLTSDSLINFEDRDLIIQNGQGIIHLEKMKLNRLVLVNSENMMDQIETTQQQLVQLNDIETNSMLWSLNDYDVVRFLRVKSPRIDNNYVAGLGRINIAESDLSIAQIFFEPSFGTSYYPFGTLESPVERAMVTGTTFRLPDDTVARIPLEFITPSLFMSNNIFLGEVDFMDSNVGNLNMIDNRFTRAVNIDGTNFHDPSNYLPFDQFEGGFGVEDNGVRTWEQWQERTFIIGEREEIRQRQLYNKLVYNYKQMHTNYKERGDMLSANAAYIDLKDLMLNYDYQNYIETGSFESWVQYQIGKLLKFYIRSGTSPARAIVISFLIILFFSFIYFLFPSEWDTKSKVRLIGDYRKFIDKNDHGYVQPFFVMVAGIFRSWLNAFALSLNAFVTLGFGAIPTQGVGRYICIIQGFIGWFLLSIFTVALINQVLI
ncbi:MAG: hypothetical protein R3283_04505, partial [Balneolaceae bacterium]|nr:hypothetical protein [Balneolaceae bacterium]